MAQTIKGEYLKGLKFTGSTPKKEKTESGEKIRHIPFERDLKPGDVLDAKVTKAGLAIVTADGHKHIVEVTTAQRKQLEADLAKDQGSDTPAA